MRKFLIDTDTGIDDSIAIMMAACQPDVEIVAITSCFGTATIENTTKNILDLCDCIDLKTRIAKGAEKPIVAPKTYPGEFHGKNGMGDAVFPPSSLQLDPTHAWDVIYQEAVKANGELIIVTLGPVTNMGIALLKYEDLPKYVKKVVVMGGGTKQGNVTPYCEANIWNDAHAAEILFKSGMDIYMDGLNATEQVRMTTKETNRMFAKRTILNPMLDKMLETYKHSQNVSGEFGNLINDAAAMTVAIDPTTAEWIKYNVTVETAFGNMYGRTVVDFRPFSNGEKNINVVMKIDKQAYMRLLDEMITFYQR